MCVCVWRVYANVCVWMCVLIVHECMCITTPWGWMSMLDIHFTPVINFFTSSRFARSYTLTVVWVCALNKTKGCLTAERNLKGVCVCVCKGTGGDGSMFDKEERIKYVLAHSNEKQWFARVECDCLHSSFQFWKGSLKRGGDAMSSNSSCNPALTWERFLDTWWITTVVPAAGGRISY